jgi:hypothetical protein
MDETRTARPKQPRPVRKSALADDARGSWTLTQLTQSLDLDHKTIKVIAKQAGAEPERVGTAWVFTREQALAIEAYWHRIDPNLDLRIDHTGRRGRPKRVIPSG